MTRIFRLFGADLGVFLGGGIGTAEEIGFVLAMKAAGHSLVKDKPMLLVNSLMPDGRQLCDGYLEFFGTTHPPCSFRGMATPSPFPEQLPDVRVYR